MRKHRSDITIRLMHAGDDEAVNAVFAGLSPRSRYLRFHTPLPRLTAPWRHLLLDIDGVRHTAMVAEHRSEHGIEPVGIARLVRTGPVSAELAFSVVDAWQRSGVGRRLLSALVMRAADLGYERVTALVLIENRGAVALLRSVLPDGVLRRSGAIFEFCAPVPRPARHDRVPVPV
jgi:RimJ/RimL family protein N-acetyltransferase